MQGLHQIIGGLSSAGSSCYEDLSHDLLKYQVQVCSAVTEERKARSMAGKIVLAFLLLTQCSVLVGTSPATDFLRKFNMNILTKDYESGQAAWEYNTNLTDHNSKVSVAKSLAYSDYMSLVRANASKYDLTSESDDTKRQFKFILSSATSKNVTVRKNVADDGTKLEKLYSKACINATVKDVPTLNGTWNGTKCLSLDPNLYKIMSKSRNYTELEFVWKSWRDATGPKMKTLYEGFVKGLNTGAVDNKWKDYGEYVRSWYEVGDQLGPIAEKLWMDLKPFYEELHAYVRFKLTKKYPEVTDGEPIPAHLLGNMWAQSWVNIYSEVAPFPSKYILSPPPSGPPLNISFHVFHHHLTRCQGAGHGFLIRALK